MLAREAVVDRVWCGLFRLKGDSGMTDNRAAASGSRAGEALFASRQFSRRRWESPRDGRCSFGRGCDAFALHLTCKEGP